MPLVWRLAQPQFADELDGEGARFFGGRWNSRGRSALYTASHLSLAVLEVYVHIPPELRDELPILRAVRISIPDDAGAIEISDKQLAVLLASTDSLTACRFIGDRWLDENSELVLQVPSMIVPEETNLILNPAHPRMREVRVLSSRAFQFDPRLSVGKV